MSCLPGISARPRNDDFEERIARTGADELIGIFLTEQLAGDELAAGKDVRANAELWIATGLHRCGPVHVVSGNVDPRQMQELPLQGRGPGLLTGDFTVPRAGCEAQEIALKGTGREFPRSVDFRIARLELTRLDGR